jgi:hypothetical protein
VLTASQPKRDKTKGATGGMLAQIGSRGLLVLKDFTTILSMNRDARAQIIAAFREIADGRWERSVVKVIMRVWRAYGVIGMTIPQALEVIWRLSIGSIPKLRRRSLEILLQEAARPSQRHQESDQIEGSAHDD